MSLIWAVALMTTIGDDGSMAGHGMETRWAKQVSTTHPHPEYPRPQLVRKDWLNLNGQWDFETTALDAAEPAEFRKKILVPFPVESKLSGIHQIVDEKTRLWYRRSFAIPDTWRHGRALLHFGAVDWDATVWLNGKNVGSHRGGYDAFTFDVTSALREGQQELVVSVVDPTDTGTQPRGKQVLHPGGIMYVESSGIWQTVWLEPVPTQYIRGVRVTPDFDAKVVRVLADAEGGGTIKIRAHESGRNVSSAHGAAGELLDLDARDVKPWSPESPHLCDLTVSLLDASGHVVDEVETYFGMRKFSVGKDGHGVTRLMLNGRPEFMVGPLDQGFWPDGLYTAPTDDALRYDLEVTKKLGFNMVRKHVKVEPARWYTWCDRLGLIVWQDMPSGDRSISPGEADIVRTPESAAQFKTEFKAMVDGLYNFPSIGMWVVFNEGWGQFDTAAMTDFARSLDPTRLINSTTGWEDRGVGDVHDWHIYPGPGSPIPEPRRAAVLGEFGGLGLPTWGHTWAGDANWGYVSYRSTNELTTAFVDALHGVWTLIGSPGLSAAVYTQTTDVETECNGLMTYDREILKMDPERTLKAVRQLFLPPPTVRLVVPTSQKAGIEWRFTTNKPADDWVDSAFDDRRWSRGPGGFGTDGTPGAVVRTKWDSADIWIRRSFDVGAVDWKSPHLCVHHDEDTEIYIDGKLVASLHGYVGAYVFAPIAAGPTPGRHTLAVHCHQTTGGQYIDVGIVDLEPNVDR